MSTTELSLYSHQDITEEANEAASKALEAKKKGDLLGGKVWTID